MLSILEFMECEGYTVDDLAWWSAWQVCYERGELFRGWAELGNLVHLYRSGIVSEYIKYEKSYIKDMRAHYLDNEPGWADSSDDFAANQIGGASC
jgi:hypothetical protein